MEKPEVTAAAAEREEDGAKHEEDGVEQGEHEAEAAVQKGKGKDKGKDNGKGKKRAAQREESEDEDEDGGESEEDGKGKGKKARPTNKEAAKGKGKSKDGGAKQFDLGGRRIVTVDSWKGRCRVDIREHYLKDKDDEASLAPTKKGISLTPEQWAQLKNISGRIDTALETLEE